MSNWEKEFRQKFRWNWSQKRGGLDEAVAFISKARQEAKQEAMSEARASALKELIERARKEAYQTPVFGVEEVVVSFIDLDQLAQEIMKGKK